MSEHSQWAPSGWERWSTCPGSVEAIESLPEEEQDRSSDYADEGTAAHTFGADCLSLDADAAEMVGATTTVNDVEYTLDDEMAGHLQVYLDYVRALPGKHHVEVRVSIPPLPKYDNKGTSDHVSVDADEGVLYVTDLKYGRGVKVYADCGQLKLYALGALMEKAFDAPIKKVVLSIVQPRLDHIDRHEMSIEDLYRFEAQAKAAVDATLVPGAPRVPSTDACRWCPFKAHCPELAASVRETTSVKADVLTPEALAQALGSVDMIESWIDAIRTRANAEIRSGNRVPGFKLVLGREGNRQWSSTEDAEAALKSIRLAQDLMYEKKIISPTVAEKLATKTKKQPEPPIGPRSWKKLEELIVRAPAQPTLVPERDPRAALTFTPPSAADMPDLDAPEQVENTPVDIDALF